MKPMCQTSSCRYKALPIMAALVLWGLRSASAADYPATVLADDPLAYYRMEETDGTDAKDSSASGLYPAIYNLSDDVMYPRLAQPGITTNSISLSASSASCVTAGYYSDFNQQSAFSFEIWARPTSLPTAGNYRCPIGNFSGWGAPVTSGWYVYQTPDVPSAFALVTPSGVWISAPNYNLFDWYHLAGTYDGTNMSFYVNGVLIGTQKANGYLANAYTTFSMGQRGDYYGYFDGNLDECAYYTHTLSGAQILTHYQVGTNSIRAAFLPPAISTDAVSTTNYAGHAASFGVIADGTTPLTYQWYKGTAPISGAKSKNLTFTCVPADNGTTYRVVISNIVGVVTSSVVTLSVSTGLEVDGPLTSITRKVGSVAAFEVAADGALPLSYQWHKGDASVIAGATNAILWLSNVQLTDNASSYYVTISNPFTSTNSDPATLTVQTRTVNPPVGGYAKMVVGDGPVAFWQLDEASGPTAVDTVGSFDGTYIAGAGSFAFGAATGIPRETDGALGMTSGSTISIPFAIELNSPTAFSAEGWFQPASLASNGNDYRTAMSSMSNPYGAGPTGWLLYQTGGNNWSWWPYNGFWTGVQLTCTDPIVAGQWYHIALTYDGTTFTLYVNGVAKASGVDSGFVQNGNVPPGGAAAYNYNYNTTLGLPVGSGPTTLGWRNPVDFNPFSGTMDDLAFYNKALSAQQVQNHFLNTTRLNIQSYGLKTVISWTAGTLQTSTAVEGPYVDVSGATSPYTNSVGGSQHFYRAKLQ